MLNAFWHLAVLAWGAMIAASSTSTFGFFCWMFGGAVFIGLAQVSYSWFTASPERGEETGLLSAIERTWRPFLVELGALAVLTLLVWSSFMWRTVYYERTGMRWAYTREVQRNKDLKEQLEHRKSEMDTSDPAFGNTIYLLQAFSIFRNYLHGESCVVHITAPRESMEFASMIAQFSISTSNCPTFGPDGVGFDRNPDLARETLGGIEPDVIVFHAARDDNAANELFARLSNLVPLKRSYEPSATPERFYQIPPGGYKHTVWLQFGANIHWNEQ